MALWAEVDRMMDAFLSAMVIKAGAEKPHPSFEKRAQAFRGLISVVFGSQTELSQSLFRLIDDTRKYAANRHLIAHGHYCFSTANQGALETSGRYKGKDITISYDLPGMLHIGNLQRVVS